MKSQLFHILLLLVLAITFPMLANAQEPTNKNYDNQSKKYECKLISRADAIRQARKRAKGKVVGVQLNKNGRRSSYRVRMLVDKKRVKTLSINACR